MNSGSESDCEDSIERLPTGWEKSWDISPARGKQVAEVDNDSWRVVFGGDNVFLLAFVSGRIPTTSVKKLNLDE